MKNQTVGELIISQILQTYNLLNGFPKEYSDPIIREEFEKNMRGDAKHLFYFVIDRNLSYGTVEIKKNHDIFQKMAEEKEQMLSKEKC